MTLRELRRLVAQGEGQRLEFKRKAVYPFKILKEVVALANAQGGVLLIGVSDDGTIPGLKHPEDDEYVMKNYIHKYCSPDVEYNLETISVLNHKSVLAFHIYESMKKPIFRLYDLKKKIGKAYIRSEDKSLQASKEARKILKFQNQEISPYSGFSYGEHERKLVQYIEQNQGITIDTFTNIADISRRDASELLIRLTLCNLIELCPREHGDFFVMKKYH